MRFQSESPFLDQEALAFLRPGDGLADEAEEALAPADGAESLVLEGETRRPGQFRLRADDPAAEPRRTSRTVSHESFADTEADELEEDSESSLPGHFSRRLDRRSEISAPEFGGELPSGELELWDEGETRSWGQLQLDADDPAAEPRRQTRSTRQEAADWQLEDPTGTLEELQDLDELSAAAELETPLD